MTDLLTLLKTIRELYTSGKYKTNWLDLFNAVADLTKLVGNTFLTNDESFSDSLLSQQPFTADDVVERIDSLIDLHSKPEGIESLQIPAPLYTVLAALIQQIVQSLLQKAMDS